MAVRYEIARISSRPNAGVRDHLAVWWCRFLFWIGRRVLTDVTTYAYAEGLQHGATIAGNMAKIEASAPAVLMSEHHGRPN